MELTTLRHETDRGILTGRLSDVAAAAVDMVASSASLDYHADVSQLVLEPYVAGDGVYTTLPVTFTRTSFRQLVERGDIPLRYADLLAKQDTDLLAHNINERGKRGKSTLFRLLRSAEGEPWQCRAVLSNGYQAIDNLDMLTAVIRGAGRAGVDLGDCNVEADWTDDRFRLRIAVPGIAVHADDLLDGYRSPYARDADLTRDASNGGVGLLWAGLEASNSETGGGAAQVAPRAVFRICNNGMTRKVEAIRSVHLGGRLEAGPVQWSAETRRRSVELIESKMSDAVTRFCSTDYLEGIVNELRAAKGVPVANTVKAFEVVQARLGFSAEETAGALDAFVKGGDLTVLGVGQAVTAAAQLVSDGDRQSEMETAFWDIVSAPTVFAGAS